MHQGASPSKRTPQGLRRSARPRRALVPIAATALGLAALTLSLMVPGTPAPMPDDRPLAAHPEPSIRVRVTKKRPVLTLTGTGAASVRSGLDTIRMINLPMTIRVRDGQLELTDASPMTFHLELDTPIEVARSDSAPLELDGVAVGPAVLIRVRTESDLLDAIAQLPLESYIAGVVARELYAGWPIETFKAQAVAARSYALSVRADARARGRPYDLDASTRHQGFGGVTSMRIAQQAVDATRSLVLTDHGKLVRAYYSGVCGGRAASARDVWTPSDPANTDPALDAAPRQPWCDHAPLYRWVAVRYEPALRDRLRAWGRARSHPLRRIDRLTAIEPSATNAVGRPVRYRITDTTGRTIELTAEQLRIACNTPTSTLTPPPARSRVHSGDLTATIAGDRVEITGRGAGHGVGLCQYGAAAMGRAGYDWRAILATYYPGAAIEPWHR